MYCFCAEEKAKENEKKSLVCLPCRIEDNEIWCAYVRVETVCWRVDKFHHEYFGNMFRHTENFISIVILFDLFIFTLTRSHLVFSSSQNRSIYWYSFFLGVNWFWFNFGLKLRLISFFWILHFQLSHSNTPLNYRMISSFLSMRRITLYVS